MRWLPKAIPILIGIVVLDFALAFGLEAVRILTSPISGLDQATFARTVYGLGSIGQLGPDGFIKLGGMFGGVYLTISILCGVYLASRIHALFGGRAAHDLLDATLILMVVVTLLAATPAILQGATEILMLQRLPTWMVALVAILSMVERIYENDDTRKIGLFERTVVRLLTRKNEKPSNDIAPAIREGAQDVRLNELRNAAGMNVQAEIKSVGTPMAVP